MAEGEATASQEIDWTESYRKYPAYKGSPIDREALLRQGVDLPLLGRPRSSEPKPNPGESLMDFVRFIEQFEYEEYEYEYDLETLMAMFRGEMELPAGKRSSLELWNAAKETDG